MSIREAIFGKGSVKPKASMTSKEYREEQYKKQKEDWHQENLVAYLDRVGIYYEISLSGIFLPNTNKKGSQAYLRQHRANMKTLNTLRSQGWNNGSSDVIVYLPKVNLHIELKSMTGRASKEQLEVQKKINKLKYAEYHIVKGYLACVELIEKNK